MSSVAVFGIGYVGCVSAACLARDGHTVVGVDIDADKVAMLNRGEAPVSEPGLAELVEQQVGCGTLRATTSLEEAVAASEIALVTVGTPSAADGSVSVAALKDVLRDIGAALAVDKRDYTVVVRSTLLPGLLEEMLAPTLVEASGRALGPGMRLGNNPEFLRESSAIKDYDDPPFVIVGVCDDWDAAEVLALYEKVPAEQIVTDSRSAAMIKYACNAFHAMKVAFANEIGALAKCLKADGHEVMRIVCLDDKLNISPAYLRPGFAFGGSCLPKDLRALVRYAQQQALRADLLSAVLTSNEEHLRRAVAMIQALGVRRVGLVGLSFKPDTDDLRESPQVILAETLLGRGTELKIYDPGVAVTRLRGRNLAYVDQRLPHLARLLVEEPSEICEHAELVVLATGVADHFPWHERFQGELIDLRSDLAVDPSPRQTASKVDR